MMGLRGWRLKLREIPVVGGVADLVGMVASVYDAIGWSDPTYSIRTGRERLAEAQKIAAAEKRPGGEVSPALSALDADEQDAGEGHRPASQGDG